MLTKSKKIGNLLQVLVFLSVAFIATVQSKVDADEAQRAINKAALAKAEVEENRHLFELDNISFSNTPIIVDAIGNRTDSEIDEFLVVFEIIPDTKYTACAFRGWEPFIVHDVDTCVEAKVIGYDHVKNYTYLEVNQFKSVKRSEI